VLASSLADTDPLETDSGALQTLQSGFFTEAENASFGGSTVSNTDYSNGSGVTVGDLTDDISFNFDLDYTIPSGEVGLAIRLDTLDGTHPPFDLIVGGENVQGVTADSISSGLKWFGTGITGIVNDLTSGTNITAELDATGTGGGPMEVDAMFAFDGRQSYNFDNSVDANNALDGPELFPNVVEQAFAAVSTGRTFEELDVTSSWKDGNVDNNQFIEIKSGSGSFDRTNNSTTASTTGGPARSGQVRIGLSRYGSQTTTPTTGIKGQAIQSYELTPNPDGIVPDGIAKAETQAGFEAGTLSGDTLREAAHKASSGGDILTHVTFADTPSVGGIDSDTTVLSSEVIEFLRE